MQGKETNKKQTIQIKQIKQRELTLMYLLEYIHTPARHILTKRYIIPTYINEHSEERKE